MAGIPDGADNVLKNLYRRMKSINCRYQACVKVQNRFCLRLVGQQTLPDHFFVCVIQAVVLNRTLSQSSNKFVAVRTREMEDLSHINQPLHKLGLIHIAWYSVKHQS